MRHQVVVESSATGDALLGIGTAYTSTAIEQDAAYWELHVEGVKDVFYCMVHETNSEC